MSQASNTTSGPPPPALPAATQPRMDPLQSLYTDPAVISVDKQPQSTGPMPPLPVAAKAASDLESDLKPTKAKKAGHGKMYFQPLKREFDLVFSFQHKFMGSWQKLYSCLLVTKQQNAPLCN